MTNPLYEVAITRFRTPERVAATRGATLGMPRIRLQAFMIADE